MSSRCRLENKLGTPAPYAAIPRTRDALVVIPDRKQEESPSASRGAITEVGAGHFSWGGFPLSLGQGG